MKPCETYDLAKIQTPADYQAISNNTDAMEGIEQTMQVWLKQLEQVGQDCINTTKVKVTFYKIKVKVLNFINDKKPRSKFLSMTKLLRSKMAFPPI